ncbi:uncharacterized protein LOC126891067 [Diabrotica virgifera virgifera]|uniref:Cilia- and flagella-associated protein 126 n=1 Tax=Diabrotica virgifera virgifera TaxID=50390 RepID=A0A6P7G9I4_DIAVI|nr:uncharacterized protein LOC126891067 [Diabrotica virgifera virgifera]
MQYEPTFKPKVLKNWEVPKLNVDKPRRRSGKTKIIANDRGHLLPEIHKTNNNPWGNFVGTWRLPKKVDKKTAFQINGLLNKEQEQDKNIHKPTDTQSPLFEIGDKDENKENAVEQIAEAVPYVPGDLTDKEHQHPTYEKLSKNRFPTEQPLLNGFPRIRDDFSKLPEVKQDVNKEVEEFYATHKQMVQTHPSYSSPLPKKERILSPIIAAISNFNLAKKLHKENLEHNPLPDTLTDAIYRKMLLHRQGKDYEGKEHFATGVGWKGYPGYGPTRCTKLKVYRPKTSGSPKDETICSFDRKWRFIRQSKVTPMDLAICWDLTPEDPKDEPDRPKHIDGSNGSAAPAVFSLVHTPKEEDVDVKCDGLHCGTLFEHSNKGNEEKEYFFHRSKRTPPRSIHSDSEKSDGKKRAKSAIEVDKCSIDSKLSSLSAKSRAKSAYNLLEADNNSNTSKNNLNLHRSTPNLDEILEKRPKKCNKIHNKFCVACEMKNVSLTEKRPKSEYKTAFKAGVPNKIVSRPIYNLKVARPKDPYMVKNYVIDSLAPPFSFQKKKREDYPEHWRLATVYQHSYKPIYARKRPFMQTVFK